MTFGSKERYGFETCVLPRTVLHSALLKEVNDIDIRWGIRVTGVWEVDAGEGGTVVELGDGTIIRADLVIGADGIHSVVRDSLFNGKYPTEFKNQSAIGGFIPISSLPPTFQRSLQTESVTVTFGKTSFFGYWNASSLDIPEPFISWWSNYDTPIVPHPNYLNYEEIRAQLLKKHGDWVSPHDEASESLTGEKSQAEGVFASIIRLALQPTSPSKTVSTRPVVLPHFFTPRLPGWSNATFSPKPNQNPNNKGRIVLLGDAAHTSAPDIGQGTSCALEDAVVYALLLKHYLSSDEPPPYSPQREKASAMSARSSVLENTAKAYEAIRKTRGQAVMDNGDCAKVEMNFFLEWLRDFGLWVLSKCPESMYDGIFAYDAEKVVAKYLAEPRCHH
jgi:2-polyprenyl-6-methoxyphenol hydroxylase-like FAD-dependent oxidoreductase